VEKLKQQLGLLESKYQTTLSQRDTLVARQRRAKASMQVTEFTSTLSPLDASGELDRMERKIRGNEAKTEALAELGTDSFDAQFRELDYDLDLEKELEALKGGSSVSGELGTGSTDDSAPTSSSASPASGSSTQA
jgi:phage shock protein A